MAKRAKAKKGTSGGDVDTNEAGVVATTATGSGVAGLIVYGIAVVYLCAFSSLWTQLPGLYFTDGTLWCATQACCRSMGC
eukprot:m.182680 g.182680  ORF g.182680 m.182680 type:complete len:80 (+) comp18069_c3_seq3:683-922(+)